MRTFSILATGWVVGGALIVGLGATAARRVPPAAKAGQAAESRSTARTRTVDAAAVPTILRTTTPGGILIPVAGITREQLRDTFDEPRGGGRVHRAMDILAPHGTPVVAAVDGTIRKLFNSRAGGLTIYQYDLAEQKIYYYAHLDRYASNVAEGLVVKQGTVIGYVGTTGNAGNTPHLHFSIELLPPTKEWWKGEPLNPYPLLTDAESVAR